MKNILIALPLAGALCASASAQQTGGAPIPPELLALQRSDWGCEVLLCLANPQGPTAAAACVPPIERLWRALARGDGFPTCNMGSGGDSYARPGYSQYDACPSGTSELTAGETAMLAAPMSAAAVPAAYRSGAASTYTQASADFGYIGIGDRANRDRASFDLGRSSAKVCVAGPRGTRTISYGDSAYQVSVYDTIYMQQAHWRPRYIDVYVDNRVWQRVRW